MSAQISVPESMTAIRITRPGGPEVLEPFTRPVPVPGEGEVLIRVHAAGVNYPDVLQRQGRYPPPPGAPEEPGLEVAGEVVATGAAAMRWRPGDRVCALVAGGGYAEYCVAPAANCLPVPAGLSMEEAAALPETFFTVWTNVFDRGRLKAGDTFLVHGGAGGIGTTAIQMARAMGARVFTTAGSDENCRFCEELGAEWAFNYHREDWVAGLKALLGKRGIDVTLDIIGGDYIQKNITVAAREGRIININYQKGAKVEVDFLPVMLKRLTLTGSTLRIRPVAEKAAIAMSLESVIWPLIEKGEIRPVLDSTFPLRQAAAAHARIEGPHRGKIVLVTAAHGA
jgi:putative PIG3 family NAD(P)H quinone oxidoreductase